MTKTITEYQPGIYGEIARRQAACTARAARWQKPINQAVSMAAGILIGALTGGMFVALGYVLCQARLIFLP